MPSGKTHSKITLTAACILPPLLLCATGDLAMPCGLALGILATLPIKVAGVTVYLNPDMDIVSNVGHLSKALGLDAYQKTVSHRAGLRRKDWDGVIRNPVKVLLLSHVPVLGSLIRMIPVLLLLFIISSIVPLPTKFYVWACIGMVISDICHIAADIIWSTIRTRRGVR